MKKKTDNEIIIQNKNEIRKIKINKDTNYV